MEPDDDECDDDGALAGGDDKSNDDGEHDVGTGDDGQAAALMMLQRSEALLSYVLVTRNWSTTRQYPARHLFGPCP